VFHDPEKDLATIKIHGAYKIYSIIIKYFPYAPGTKDQYPDMETFVLSQTDFSPQNIFFDDNGNVTGFIDWDFTDTKPRYPGWARQPVWLCEDCDSEITGGTAEGYPSFPRKMLTPACEVQRYRKDYARYLIEACGNNSEHDDWRFALNAISSNRYTKRSAVRKTWSAFSHASSMTI
jgi:aminoglycoside phosphotransferase (APT) family kinase protein